MDAHTHTRKEKRHSDVAAISKVIEFVTFALITSVFDKTFLHDTAACVWIHLCVRDHACACAVKPGFCVFL